MPQDAKIPTKTNKGMAGSHGTYACILSGFLGRGL